MLDPQPSTLALAQKTKPARCACPGARVRCQGDRQRCGRCGRIFRELSDAERRALEVMARAAKWVDGGKVTDARANWYQVNAATANRLERHGLAKSKLEDRYGDGERWGKVYTITRAGMKAIGWQGKVLP